MKKIRLRAMGAWAKRSTPYHSLGFTLIECMVTLTMSLIILIAVYQIFLATSFTQHIQENILNNIYTEQEVTRILTSEIAQAGYIGCAKLTDQFSVEPFLTPENRVRGKDLFDITISHAEFPASELIMPVENSQEILTNNIVKFSAGDIALISDCKHAEMVKIASAKAKSGSQLIELNVPLKNHYEKYAEISHLEINHFYLQSMDSQGYSLILEDINKRKTVLINSINKIELKYSTLENGQLVTLPANEIANWGKIVGVQIDGELKSQTWHAYASIKA